MQIHQQDIYLIESLKVMQLGVLLTPPTCVYEPEVISTSTSGGRFQDERNSTQSVEKEEKFQWMEETFAVVDEISPQLFLLLESKKVESGVERQKTNWTNIRSTSRKKEKCRGKKDMTLVDPNGWMCVCVYNKQHHHTIRRPPPITVHHLYWVYQDKHINDDEDDVALLLTIDWSHTFKRLYIQLDRREIERENES